MIWLTLSVILIASMALSSCAPAATQAPANTAAPQAQATQAPAAQMVTIRWRTRPDNQAEQDVYQKISDDLSTQLAPQGIKLQYDPAPVTGYEDKLKTELAAGNAPDVFWIPGANTADYAKIGLIADLKPLADKDTSFKITDYYDAPMKELQNGGHLWGIPRDISTLAAAGKWDWTNFERVAKEITHPADKVFGFSFSNW